MPTSDDSTPLDAERASTTDGREPMPKREIDCGDPLPAEGSSSAAQRRGRRSTETRTNEAGGSVDESGDGRDATGCSGR